MTAKLDKAIKFLNNYKEKTKCKGVVLGLSGGKDSTTVAMLVKKVWGDNMLAVLMPNSYQADIDDSLEIAKRLNIPYKVVNIGQAVDAIESACGKDILSEKALTNVPPRIRMTTLYLIGQSIGYRVIGTGNFSESFIGWFTKWGDGANDFNPIAHLTCSEVIELGLELAEEFNLPKEYIVKVPADGLTGKSDEDNFGFTYKQLDDFILRRTSGDPALDQRILNMHSISMHKRTMPYSIREEMEYEYDD